MFVASSRMFNAEQQREILNMTSEEFKAKKDVKRILEQLEAQEAVAIGKEYIDFSMETPEGKTVSMSDYAGKGKYVFIDFWAAWCGPCISEMPNVVDAYEKYKNKDFEIVLDCHNLSNVVWRGNRISTALLASSTHRRWVGYSS